MAIERNCGKCKGKGSIPTKGKRSTWEILVNSYPSMTCPVCHGNGRNPNYMEKQCEYSGCYTTLPFHKDTKFPPKYCDNHKIVVAREKQEQHQRQDAQRQQQHHQPNKQSPRTQASQSARPAHTQSSGSRQDRPQQTSQWLEKSCGRSKCRNVIRYLASWEHIPNFCKDCKAEMQKLNQPYDTTDRGYVMPGMGQTIGQMGGIRGKHYPHQGRVHCTVFDGMGPNDVHTSWDFDVVTEEVTKLHSRPNAF